MKADHWFHWERQATVQPILMCLEAWMEPMKQEYGRSWPTTILVYNKDIISWYNTWPDLLDYGEYLIKIFVNEKKRAELNEDIKSQAAQLEEMFSRFDSLSFPTLSDTELLQVYEQLHSKYIKWFVPGGLVEPIGYQGERMVRKLLSQVPDSERNECFSLITTTTQESFSKRELRDLLKIAVAKNQEKDIQPLLVAHSKKYFWLHNNYFSTEVLGKDFFEDELELALKKYPDPEKQISKMEEELKSTASKKSALVLRLGLGDADRNLIELLDMFAWYQDYRKEYVMKILHYLDVLLEEIGKRKGLTLNEMKYVLSEELPSLLQGTFDSNMVKQRMKRCLIHFDAASGELVHGTGEWSIEKEKELFHSLKHEDDVLEIRGVIANKGFASGKARVTMSAEEANSIQQGEVLVTSMTTPDFVTAIKRASAIVTNEGGILSHAAVVSREFGVPCIVGTKMATRIFKTGDLLEVDCELGVVRKLSE